MNDVAAGGVDPSREVAKVPRQGHRCDGRDGRESYAAMDALQWEGFQFDEEVYGENILGQGPAAFLPAEGAVSKPDKRFPKSFV